MWKAWIIRKLLSLFWTWGIWKESAYGHPSMKCLKEEPLELTSLGGGSSKGGKSRRRQGRRPMNRVDGPFWWTWWWFSGSQRMHQGPRPWIATSKAVLAGTVEGSNPKTHWIQTWGYRYYTLISNLIWHTFMYAKLTFPPVCSEQIWPLHTSISIWKSC